MRDSLSRRQPPRPARVAQAVALLLCTGALATGPAHAQPAPAPVAASAPQPFDIPAGPLDAALRGIAAQAGVALTFTPEQTAGLRSAGVRGSHSVEGAFAAVLSGTPLQMVRLTNGGYALRGQPADGAASGASSSNSAPTLAEVRVEGRQDRASTSDGSGSYAAARLGMGGMAQKPREIPQSVSVMTRQRLEDQQLSTLNDVLEQTPGVTVQQTSSVITSFYSRGFQITNIKVDGGAGLYHGYQFNAVPDAAQFEQVEVLRGADALFSGSGEPGGTLNLVRKRPTRERQTEVMLSAGRWNTFRGDLDVSGPLSADGRVRGRGVLSWRETGSFQRGADSDAGLLYGVLEWDATPSTLVTAGASHDKRHDPFVGNGLPRYSSGADLKLPRSTYLAGAWNHFDREVNTVFAKVEQKLGDRWSLTLNAMHMGQHDDRAGVTWASTIDSTGRGGAGTPARYRYSSDQSTVDLTLKGSFDAAGRSHEVLAGANWQSVKSTAYGMTTPTRYTVGNIFLFNPEAYPDPGGYVPFFDYPNYGIRQSGVFGVARLQLADRLKLIVGARHGRHEYDYIYRDLNGLSLPTTNSVTHYKESGVTTPYGGLTWDIDERWTAYASFAETYKSQADQLKAPLPGTPLDPITGRNVEVGVKGELLDGRVDVSAALYHIKRNGAAVRDSAYPADIRGDLGSRCCYVDDGRIVSQGLDLEVSGELRPGWLMSAGYTFNSNSNKSSNSRESTVTPRHLLKVFTSVRLPGEASAWRVGGGVNVQSATYKSGNAAVLDGNGLPTGRTTPFQFREPGRAVWDLFAEYRINRSWSATLNLRNVFDKTYYQTVGISGYGNWYGEPRNASVTLRGRF